jgi:hypothetical protein
MRHVGMRWLVLWIVALSACADTDVDPASTDEPSAEAVAARGGSGTPCGPDGLVCSKNQICCSTDPLPPAPARFVCRPKGSVCNP